MFLFTFTDICLHMHWLVCVVVFVVVIVVVVLLVLVVISKSILNWPSGYFLCEASVSVDSMFSSCCNADGCCSEKLLVAQ